MRKLLIALIALVPMLAVLPGLATASGTMKVVYHVSEAEKVPFVLGNIKNHIRGVGEPDHVEIVVVAHGPGLKPFHQSTNPQISSMVDTLQSDGVTFNACGNTMNALDYTLSDLLPDFIRRDEGGVVRIAELQSKGFVYLRP